MKRLVILLALLMAAAAAPAAAQSGGLATFETAGLSIETAAGERHDFEVEIAETPAQRSQGLMFRRQMAADAGMLFLFGGSQVRGMWMKNTLIRSEEHTSELQSLMRISHAVFCLKKNKKDKT